MEVGGWREIAADQNLRMAALMLEQQGEINGLKAEVERLRGLLVDADARFEGFKSAHNTAQRNAHHAREIAKDRLTAIDDLKELLDTADRDRARLRRELAKAEREVSVMRALFVDDVYEVDPDCACGGRCKHCAAMGCEACCDGYSADHGVLTEDEKAARQAIWCAHCQELIGDADLADHNASEAHAARGSRPLRGMGIVRNSLVFEARASVALDGETFAVDGPNARGA